MNATAAVPNSLTVLQRLKLDAELTSLARQRASLLPGVPMFAFKVAQVASRIVVLLRQRGADLDAPKREREAFATDGEPDVPEQPRKLTAHLYDFDPNRKHGERKKDNAAAMALLRAIDAGEVDGANLSDEQKQTLAKYSGTGGNLVGADGLKGSAYEYYTPKPIAQGMWDLLAELGFKGGKVLDPCSGVGIFGATAPANVAMESVELNETSGRINQLVNGGPGYNAIVSPYEAVASRTSDEIYDAVITNVPFGGVHDRGSNRKIDARYQDQPLETYFILRTLEKLKAGGLAAFIVPPRVVSAKGGGREEQLRLKASYIAEFMGAYRLPNSVFGTADADTITDVIVLRKFGRDVALKIEEMREQNPAALVQANVLWQEFIEGRYFEGEGRRFILGEFKAKDPSKFRDVDRVISDQSVGNIAKLMRKFPGSRIDWKALEAVETAPIEYAEGDCMTMAGQTLQMREGAWVAIGKAASDDRFDNLGPVLSSPLAAVSAKVDWGQASEYVDYLHARSMDMDMPQWLRFANNDLLGVGENERPALWNALIAGLAATDAMNEHAGEPGFNYLEAYPVLSDMLQATASTASKAPTAFSRQAKAAFTKARIIYSRKDGFSGLWKGEGAADVQIGTLDEEAQIGALQYKVGASLPVAELQRVYGDKFDVMAEDEWCVNADGTEAKRADDYYTGNVADYLRRIDAEIKAAPNDAVRAKLLRQKEMAGERFDTVDPTALRFNLFSPFVTLEEKCEFLRRFMHPGFNVGVNNLGEPYIVYEGRSGNNATLEENLMSRIASYVSGNAAGKGVRSLALQGKELGISDREALEMLRKYATRLNTQFDGWVKSNKVIVDRMSATANDPARLYFNEVDDTTPLHIPGLNVELSLHGYQNAEVRKQARSFGGINGFDVGLGKTFTALAAVQYVQSIGVKKKTVFVVPNAVLSNWRREASRAYVSTDDCLFIGLEINETTGKATVNPSNYARDFTRVLENKHRKIFCSLEAFTMLPLKDETIERYEAYMASVDPSYSGGERKADSERAASKLSDVTEATGAKSSALPFFEDMGIDSIVADEGHMFKNSKDTLEFSGAKFLSVAEASQRGRDMQMKAWFVRGLTEAGDGVLPLTATPITNSPLEIYSMLTLAVGEKKVHDLFMGVRGADAFMDAMCIIEDDEDVGIDGTVKSYRVFRGLQNVNLLRTAIGAIATIKTGKDVKASGDDLRLPDAPETPTRVDLPRETRKQLEEYKDAYRAARELMKGENGDPDEKDLEALERVQARLGESLELVGHPFNLIQKMTALIADPELDERATFYTILAPQKATAEKVVASFNKLGKVEQRARTGPWTDDDAVVGQVTVKDDGNEVTILKIKVRAGFTPDGRVFVDTVDFKVQQEFEKLADKAGLDLDCSIPPKLAALLENVKGEEAAPRSASGRVKQLVFCDILPLHNKIKRVLSKHAGIPVSAIEIISGQSIKNPEQMQGIQDGFNAEGDDNLYRAIVANEKAEVGINLQKGTQAIHHLTIGWTPDSQHQRNGRGVRQGNTTGRVNIYHYDADGTFDEYKRNLTSRKADWISAVMDAQGGNEVQVSGGLTSEQYDELIESMGDTSKIQAIQDRAALREKMQRADNARQRQIVNLQTAQSQTKFVKDFRTIKDWLAAQAAAAFDLNQTMLDMDKRNTSKMKPETLIRFETRKAELRAKLDGMLRDLDEAATYKQWGRENITMAEAISNPSFGYAKATHKRRENIESLARHSSENIKEDSALFADWQSQVKQAEAMIEEAYKDFGRIAKGEGGAHSDRMIAAFKEGNGVLVDGQPFVPGMFLRLKDGELVVLDGAHNAIRYPSTRQRLADALRGATVIGFESPDYDAAVAEAAAWDDQQKDVPEYSVGMLFSSINPDVAKARKNETLVKYSGNAIELPSPYFRFAINPADAAQLTAPVAQLVKDQEGYIKRWEGTATLIPSTTEVKGSSEAYSASKRIKALATWAKGAGVKLTVDDVSVVATGSAGQPGSVLPLIPYELDFPADTKQRLGQAESQEQLDAVAAELLATAASWIDAPAAWTFLTACNDYTAKSIYNSKASQFKAMARHAEEQAAKAEQEAKAKADAEALEASRSEQFKNWRTQINDADGKLTNDQREAIKADTGLKDGEATELLAMAPPDLASAIAGVSLSANGKIGLTGKTMERVSINGTTKQVKDFIKMAAEEAGGRARWRGDQLQWDVTPQAWELLCNKYAEAAKLVNLCPAVE